MDGFYQRVYVACRQIPKGKVATYGQLAAMAGNPRMSRQVGWALHRNPQPGIIPCHRVVNRKGELSGAFAFGGLDAQRSLLIAEDVEVSESGTVDLNKYLMDIGTL